MCNLPRASYLKRWVSHLIVDRVETPDPVEIDYLMEVPTDQDVHFSNRRDSDVLGIDHMPLTNDTLINVTFRECLGFL